MLDIFPQIPPVALPEIVPNELPQQRFHLGEWVRWFQVPNGDFGRVIGVIYTQQASCIATGLHYLVLLDERSPSCDTCACDFAFEEDIELLDNSSLKRLGAIMSEAQQHQQLLKLHNQMFISPQDFSYRWGLGYEELAKICAISKSTAYHWLGGQASRREAGLPYQRIMAVADFLFANAEVINPLLEEWHNSPPPN